MKGLELAAAFYWEEVAPRLSLPHAAGLLGPGSEVLGYDTERSHDHDWGARCLVFTEEELQVPPLFQGWPTLLEVRGLSGWLEERLGFDPRVRLGAADWLRIPQQRLLEVTAGAVFHDDTGELQNVRRLLAWYPDEVWHWLLACQWRRIAQEEAFVGRTAEVGDELGSRLVTARLARDLVRLWLLMERRYAPYSKWLGSALGQAPIGAPLLEACAATDYPARERALVRACQLAAERFNQLELGPPLEGGPRPYFDRPYLVLGADRFVQACLERLGDSPLRAWPLVGSVDTIDSTDLLASAGCRRANLVWPGLH